jgi:hypothetical protein
MTDDTFRKWRKRESDDWIVNNDCKIVEANVDQYLRVC